MICTLITLSTNSAITALLVRRDSNLLDLVTISARITRARHLNLLRCIACRSWATLLLPLHARHVHDVIEDFLLVARCSTTRSIGNVGHIYLLSVCSVFRWIDRQTTGCSHRLVTLAWLWLAYLLVHNWYAWRTISCASYILLLFGISTLLDLSNTIFRDFDRLLLQLDFLKEVICFMLLLNGVMASNLSCLFLIARRWNSSTKVAGGGGLPIGILRQSKYILNLNIL